MSEATVPLEYAKFAVVDRAVCVWGPTLGETNLRYLKNLDPGFFLYQAEVHGAVLSTAGGANGPPAHHPALALRLAHGLALETFFSLLGAIMQAPHCVFGWLTLYKTEELRQFVSRLQNGAAVRSLPPFRPTTWEHIASVMLEPVTEKVPDGAPAVLERFCRAWRALAREFVDAASTREFNSLKHAFRVEPGRGPLRVQLVADNATAWEATSPLAHGFPTLKRMEEKGRRHHYNTGHATLALEPKALLASLQVLGCSIHNLLALARVNAGDAPTDNSVIFPNENTFSEVHRRDAPLQRVAYAGTVTVAEHEYWSEEEILSIYDERPAGSDP